MGYWFIMNWYAWKKIPHVSYIEPSIMHLRQNLWTTKIYIFCFIRPDGVFYSELYFSVMYGQPICDNSQAAETVFKT